MSKINTLKQDAEYDIVGMGEVMIRLSPPGKQKLSQADYFERNIGGSELNVVSGAAMLGARSAMITKLPDNAIGRLVKSKITSGNVDGRYLVYDKSDKSRLGLYYYENGAYPRKSSVIYDRANSSVCTLGIDEISDDIFDKTKIFHISSITLALSPELQKTALEVIKKFHGSGAKISFDVNYRAALWSEDEARAVIEDVFNYVDFLFVSEETSRRMLRRTGSLEDIMKGYSNDFGCSLVATTRREVVSPMHHNFNSKIYFDGNFYEEKGYNNIEVIDRIGSGDAYLSGVLYGLTALGDVEQALKIGNACSAVKNTVVGDMSDSSIGEIMNVIKSHNATGHQDEMVR